MIGPLIALAAGLAGAKVGAMVAGVFGFGTTMTSILAGVGYAAATMFTSDMFAEEADMKMPEYAKYPIQTSQKSSPVAKVYGTDILAGNIIYAGDPVPWVLKVKVADEKSWWDDSNVYAKQNRYKRSFLVSVCEGPASVLRIWKGKEQIYPTCAETIDPMTTAVCKTNTPTLSSSIDLSIFEGIDNQGLKAFTGKDYGEYPNLCCLFFNQYDTGPTEQIPNFVVEVAAHPSAYKYTYISESESIYGIPITGDKLLTLNAGGVAVNLGGGIVGLPCADHPFIAGEQVRIAGTTNYNGLQTLTAGTTQNELQFSHAYAAETFDGTETVVKEIRNLQQGTGQMCGASDGTLYYAHDEVGTPKYRVTRIDPDGSLHPDSEFLEDVWEGGIANRWVAGIALTPDDRYLYVWVYQEYVTDSGWMYKFDLTTGDNVWKANFVIWPGMGNIALDADANVYARVNSKINKFDADDGTATVLTTSGAVNTTSPIVVDNNLQIVLYATGNSLGAISLNGAATFTVLLDGVVAVSCVTTLDGLIYAVTATSLYKISWDVSTGLNIIDSVALPDDGQGIYADPWANIVIIHQEESGGDSNVLWYYDSDLNPLSQATGFNSDTLAGWNYGLAEYWHKGSILYAPPNSVGDITDANPADVIQDILTGARTGARFPDNYIDADSFAAVRKECQDKDLLISMVMSDQKPWQDWVDFVCSQFGGYLVWSEGKFKLGMWRSQTPVAVITEQDLIAQRSDEPGEDREPPMKVRKRNFTQTYNRVHASYSNRADEYGPAAAVFDEEVDQRRTGTTRIKVVDLSALKTGTRAQKIVNRVGFDGIRRHSIYSFALGYKNMLLEVGDVVDLSDGDQIENAIVRITSISETKDGQNLAIEAVDDASHLYPDIAWTTQETTAADYTPPTLADATINSREDMDERILFLSLAPGNAQCNGWHVYVSRDGVTYDYIGTKSIEAVTGGKANSVGTLTTALRSGNAVVYRGGEAFEVNIGTVTDLATDRTDAALLTERSLAKIGDEIIGYQTAVETATPGVWRISKLIRGLFGTFPTAHAAGEVFATLDIDVVYPFRPADIGATLYVKALAWYGAYEQDLEDVTATQIEIQGLYQRPAPATLIRLASSEMDGGSDAYSGASFSLYWNLCMRPMCRSLGPDGTPWRYGDAEADLVVDDSVTLEAYLQDPELQAIDLLFEKTDGTNIAQRSIAVAQTATITKATDLGGYNPATVKVLPRRTLRTYKQNYLTVDDGS